MNIHVHVVKQHIDYFVNQCMYLYLQYQAHTQGGGVRTNPLFRLATHAIVYYYMYQHNTSK